MWKEGFVETREEYQIRIALKLEELEPKIWMVKQKADEMRNETKAEYNELFRVLHSKLEQVGDNLKELEEASEETWQDFRGRVDGALADLNNSVGNVLSRMG
jgi:broad specificity phosphatase PhoE